MRDLIKIHYMRTDPDDVTVHPSYHKSKFNELSAIMTTNVSHEPPPITTLETWWETKEQNNQIKMPKMEEYETGDILLFSDKSFIPSRIIEYFTDSKYSHTGIVLKNPITIDSSLNKGLYVLESTWFTDIVDSENRQLKTGVQIRKLEDVYAEYNGAIFWRKLNTNRDEKFYQILTDAHSIVHNKPYDINPKDWMESLLNMKLGDVQLISRFFCSALVTYIYDKWGFVDRSTPWTIISPKDLGTENISMNRIKLICDIDKEVVIKNYESYAHYIYYTY